MPESLLSAKYAEAGPCGLTTKHILNTCQKKPGWLSKEVKKPIKRENHRNPSFHQGEKPRGAPQGGIKHQNNAKQAWVQWYTTIMNFVTRVFVTLTLTNIYTYNNTQISTKATSYILFLGLKLTLAL